MHIQVQLGQGLRAGQIDLADRGQKFAVVLGGGHRRAAVRFSSVSTGSGWRKARAEACAADARNGATDGAGARAVAAEPSAAGAAVAAATGISGAYTGGASKGLKCAAPAVAAAGNASARAAGTAGTGRVASAPFLISTISNTTMLIASSKPSSSAQSGKRPRR